MTRTWYRSSTISNTLLQFIIYLSLAALILINTHASVAEKSFYFSATDACDFTVEWFRYYRVPFFLKFDHFYFHPLFPFSSFLANLVPLFIFRFFHAIVFTIFFFHFRKKNTTNLLLFFISISILLLEGFYWASASAAWILYVFITQKFRNKLKLKILGLSLLPILFLPAALFFLSRFTRSKKNSNNFIQKSSFRLSINFEKKNFLLEILLPVFVAFLLLYFSGFFAVSFFEPKQILFLYQYRLQAFYGQWLALSSLNILFFVTILCLLCALYLNKSAKSIYPLVFFILASLYTMGQSLAPLWILILAKYKENRKIQRRLMMAPWALASIGLLLFMIYLFNQTLTIPASPIQEAQSKEKEEILVVSALNHEGYDPLCYVHKSESIKKIYRLDLEAAPELYSLFTAPKNTSTLTGLRNYFLAEKKIGLETVSLIIDQTRFTKGHTVALLKHTLSFDEALTRPYNYSQLLTLAGTSQYKQIIKKYINTEITFRELFWGNIRFSYCQ